MSPAPDPTPAELTWVRSGKLGNPAALREILDSLRSARDFLQIVDPLAQGLATVAEIEAWLVTVFQALSTPRALGLVLAELLMAWVAEYLTDGAYFIQHGNLRELLNRTGTMGFIEGAEQYLEDDDLSRRAAKQGERSQWLQFGPEAEEDGGAFQAYRQIPQLIDAQLDLRTRQFLRSATDAFQDTPFNSFDEWLSPILAAFYDPGDPHKPVVFDADKVGGFLFAVQGEDPIAVYDAWVTLKNLIFDIVENDLDFSDVWEDAYENLGLDTISQWELTDSLQWNGINSRLRPHLVPRYSSSPDFYRASTADLMPMLGNLLLDLTNLAEFAGLPFPENFSLLAIAQKLADKIRKYLSVLDALIEALTRVADILDLADVWRLAVPAETGGIDGLVERIKNAHRDDIVRVTWGTLEKVLDPNDGVPSLQEYAYGRIVSLPADTTGIPEYTALGDPEVGDWLLGSDLSDLGDAFTAAARTGFSYADLKVWRAGDTLRESRAEKLREAFPAFAFGPPGNLLIYGFGVFLVEGALYRLLSSLFGPDTDDWNEYLCDGPVAGTSVADFMDTVADASSTNVASGSLPPRPGAQAPGTGPSGGFADASQDAPSGGADATGAVSDGAVAVTSPAAPSGDRILGRLDRYGAARSVDVQGRCIGQVPDNSPRKVYAHSQELVALGQNSMPLGASGAWTGSRPSLVTAACRPPHAPIPRAEGQNSHEGLEALAFDVGAAGAFGSPLPQAATALADVTIHPGGHRVHSPTLSAGLTAAGFPAGPGYTVWGLDLGLLYPDGVVRYVRTLIVGHDAGLDLAYVSPALPNGVQLSATSPVDSAVWFAQDELVWQILPGRPAPEGDDVATSCPAVTFDIAAAFQKRASVRSGTLSDACPTTLQAQSCKHLVDVDSRGWGNWQELTLQTGSDGLSLEYVSGPGGGDSTREAYDPDGWPPSDVLLDGTFSATELLEARPALEASKWRAAADADGAVVAHVHAPAPAAVYDQEHSDPALHEHWRLLSSCAPRYAMIGLGEPGDPDTPMVLARPSHWSHLLVKTAAGPWVRVELTDLSSGAPPDDVLDRTGNPGEISWKVLIDAAVLAAYPGGRWALVVNSGPNTGIADEGTYGVQRPLAWWVPFIRRVAGDDDVYEEGDRLLVSCGPHARAGAGTPHGAFGGADPAQVGSIWYQTLPRTGSIHLRPRQDQRGGAVQVIWVCSRDSWCWPRGEHLLVGGSSHRVVVEATDIGLSYHLDERDLFSGVWVRRLTVDDGPALRDQKLALVMQSIPASNQLDVLVSEYSSGAWAQRQLGSVVIVDVDPYPLVRSLTGLKEAGGTWQIGHNQWSRSITETSVVLPWTFVGGLLPGLPAAGLERVTYTEVSSDGPDAVLDLYR